MAAQRTESNFFYDHPALVATIVTIGIIGAFLGAVISSAGGHHEGGEHGAQSGSAHPGAAPAGSGGAAKAEHK